jgi:hypothetical protein
MSQGERPIDATCHTCTHTPRLMTLFFPASPHPALRPQSIFITIVDEANENRCNNGQEAGGEGNNRELGEQFSGTISSTTLFCARCSDRFLVGEAVQLCKRPDSQLEIRRRRRREVHSNETQSQKKSLSLSLAKTSRSRVYSTASHLPQFSSIKLKDYYCHCYCYVLSFNSLLLQFFFLLFSRRLSTVFRFSKVIYILVFSASSLFFFRLLVDFCE